MGTLYTTDPRTNIAPSTAPNGPTGPYATRPRPATANRQALAFRAGEDALTGSPHGIGLLLYYKHLVARAGKETSSVITQSDLAFANLVSVRTIRRYDMHLVAAGLIQIEKVGHSYRRTISAYEPAEHTAAVAECSAPGALGAEVVILGPDPSFFTPPTGQIDPVEPDRSVRLYPLTGSKVNQDEALRPGGDLRSADPETVELLTAEKCHPATIRAFAHLDPVYVREQIDAAWRSGRGREMPNFLIGCLKTGGVYGSSWSGGRQQTKDPPPEPLESWPSIAPLPTVCPTCGALCPASWEGHCRHCEADVVTPTWGAT